MLSIIVIPLRRIQADRLYFFFFFFLSENYLFPLDVIIIPFLLQSIATYR